MKNICENMPYIHLVVKQELKTRSRKDRKRSFVYTCHFFNTFQKFFHYRVISPNYANI